ncbi:MULTISPECIES: ABC transporter ATP-binding protein [Paenibacillus]|uniref:Multidrug ABC transporter ATP-binding protein n=1 Tax=Paenibacillus odorifer TaxID=189426 RepID=A0A1R0WUI7_9BACL|nr:MULTISPECIES: ABC transporter ATP-binding protein [Paenibacillus]ETT65925.1 ABC transporter [Paenibacillus sp. FSL H8-237]OMD21533.1 multidrug ABC transporter ATP-binding protein [Paenibacillus odorifer]OME19339.1 multidrug ABC transporter ATP-binding protein [Paenibacillus odorifer]OME26970.1 multidrug ABC transporter ATP-binding protein [Paenibacillus odorifer]OME33071.1 multidrug ABC transporter ATP-binding protein [Paenibacillus odorifer]
MWKLKHYLRPYWVWCVLAPLLMLVEVTMDLLQPTLMASIVDKGVMTKDLSHIFSTGLIMLGVAFIGLIGGVGCTIFSSIASQNFGNDLRISLFEHIQKFSNKNLDQLKTGSLITRLTNDVVQLQTFVQMILRSIRSPLLLVGSLVMAIRISPMLTLILAVAVPLLSLILYGLIRLSFPLFQKMQVKLDGVNIVLQENLSGIRVVKAFVRANHEQKRFNTANKDYTEIAIRAVRLMSLNMPLMMLVLNASIVAVLWFGGVQSWNGGLPVGQLIAFINYITQLLMSMLMLSNMLTFFSRAKVSADRENEVFSTISEITEVANAKKDAIHNGRIVFDNVSFAYDPTDENLVLDGINFTAEPGETVAILGATGTGKSSLVSLIPRFYEVSSGSISIDGSDTRMIALEDLRSRIGYVMQQATLFSGTIRNNIRYGRPDATDEEVEEAAIAAEAHNFILELPQGYDTELGQRGINLSGGQKQRLSIARALLIQPTILIMDDSTSALDAATESRIRQMLKTRLRSSTNILIAQRVTSVIDADRILVLENGRIAVQGTHDGLMNSSEIYRDIWRSQMKGEEVPYVKA